MVKAKSLEEYLKNYFRSTSLENSPMSYATYRAERGTDGPSAYQRAMSEAGIAAALNSSDYGTVAEGLRQKGLASSGYSDYLTRVGTESLKATEEALKLELENTERKNAQSYLSYLSDFGEEQQRIGRRVSETLIKRGIADRDAAYKYAVGSGLTPEVARQIVESSYGVIRQRLMDEIMSKVALLQLDAEGAEIYARHMGLSLSDAAHIGRAADELIDHYVNVSDSYLEHLEELEKLGSHVFGEHIEVIK